MRSRIRIYDKRGTPIEEIVASTTREWLLNAVSECTFTVSRRDSKLVNSTFQPGNRILVTNRYTKPWGGVLDTPISWTQEGPKFTAYSHAYVLGWRESQSVDQTTNLVRAAVKLTGTPGAIFNAIINLANESEDTIIRTGDLYPGGVERSQTLTGDYLKNIKSVAQRAKMDWDVVPELQDNNTLLFRANWYMRKGLTHDIELEEGVNIEAQDEGLLEQGVIKNSIMGMGYGATDSTRLGAIRQDLESAGRYGLRHGSVTFSDVKEIATLGDNTASYIAVNAYPRRSSKVNLVDKEIFKEYNEGDYTPLTLHKYGFSDDGGLGVKAVTRIVGMTASDDDGALGLLLSDFLSA